MNKGKEHICQFDERVNIILLIMFVVVVGVLTAKGCSPSYTSHSQSKINSEESIVNDHVAIDTSSLIQR